MGVDAGAAGAENEFGFGDVDEVVIEPFFDGAVAEGSGAEELEDEPAFREIVLEGHVEIEEVFFFSFLVDFFLEPFAVAVGPVMVGDVDGDGVEFGVGDFFEVGAEPGDELGVVKIGGEGAWDGIVAVVGDRGCRGQGWQDGCRGNRRGGSRF